MYTSKLRELGGITSHRESPPTARLAQSAERKALNLVVVGSSPTVGELNLLREYAERKIKVCGFLPEEEGSRFRLLALQR